MTRTTLFTLCLFYLPIVWVEPCYAQQEVYVVTKKIEQQLDFTPGNVLLIKAEKASIEVTGWKEDYIEVSLKLVSKHPNRKVAQDELDYLGFSIESNDEGHIIQNYFKAEGKVGRVRGNLLSAYSLKVPAQCLLDITNLYGSLKISQMTSDFKGQLKFVDVDLINHRGTSQIESFFGHLAIENYQGKIFADLEKSNFSVVALDGELEVKSNYGEIYIEGGDHDKVKIEGSKTKVNFEVPNLASYNYKLRNKLGKIVLPKTLGEPSVTDDDGTSHYDREFKTSNTSVDIATSYNAIILRQTYTAR